MTTILGIDPGSRITGFGVIQYVRQQYHYITSGCIKTVATTDIAQRLWQIHEGITSLIHQYSPEHIAIEKIFMHKNPDSALKLGQARGAILVAVASRALALAEYTPRMIKQAVVGYGAATKEQVQQMVTKLLALSATPQADAADALAIAICHASHQRGIQYDWDHPRKSKNKKAASVIS